MLSSVPAGEAGLQALLPQSRVGLFKLKKSVCFDFASAEVVWAEGKAKSDCNILLHCRDRCSSILIEF